MHGNYLYLVVHRLRCLCWQAVTALQACESRVAALALFSSNEEADDIPTSHLRYLLLPHLLAEVLAQPVEYASGIRRPLLELATQKHTR